MDPGNPWNGSTNATIICNSWPPSWKSYYLSKVFKTFIFITYNIPNYSEIWLSFDGTVQKLYTLDGFKLNSLPLLATILEILIFYSKFLRITNPYSTLGNT